ncbi:NADP-dependent phosphogluconate dehydrogenase [Vibrio penaeicida]|uniref:NADP-dependent phosphogluconate dehydrogenase n=1 Tax=Vibrio penaeicida TaxID=104609 RepID=UPI000CEA552A|nr:NADP-dependent phosphogluconate dehydrogenase [Vibrio penaeicida]
MGEIKTVSVVGLGVMGKSLALNLLENDYSVIGFDLNSSLVQHAHTEAENLTSAAPFIPAPAMSAIISGSQSPRVVILSVPAGEVVDQVIEDLLEAGLSEHDIVIDTGNSLWTDSISREDKYNGRVRFFTTAVSGGEMGARFGPSLMPSGNVADWKQVQPILEAISAKHSDSVTEGNATSTPCCAYIGPAGSGHYVKMVHNGIEYADMQLICEAYHLLREGLHLSASEIGEVFKRWNQGVLGSYLLGVSAEVLQHQDARSAKPFVDIVLDKAEQKGTGLWTALNSLQVGCPAPSLTEAVYARTLSAQKALRQSICTQSTPIVLSQPFARESCSEKSETFINNLHDAMYCAKISIYAQGFDLMRTTALEQNWDLNFTEIAQIWRAGCIIRADLLNPIATAFAKGNHDQTKLDHLFLNRSIHKILQDNQEGWRKSVVSAVSLGVPTPVITSCLSYFDSLRCDSLPANLLQAQRDYFGSHGYSRTDEVEDKKYHTTWHSHSKEEVRVS